MASKNGLIDDYADVAGAKVPQATSTGYNATQAAASTAATSQAPKASAAEFTAGEATTGTTTNDQLVESRIKGIVDANSPLQQQAEARSRQRANSRGLLNSSMAVTAGQAALYDAALPIAQQDAGTVASQARANQDAKNQFGLANMQERNQTSRFNVAEANKGEQFNTGEANTTARFNTGEVNKVGLVNAEQVNRASEFGANAANTMAGQNAKTQADVLMQERDNQNKLALQSMDSQTRTNLVNIEANYKTLMQASQSASDMYSQTLQAISQIQNNKDLDAASRNRLIDQQTQLLQNGLNLIGSVNNLDLSQLLDFSAVTGGANAAPDGEPRQQIPESQTGGDIDAQNKTGAGA